MSDYGSLLLAGLAGVGLGLVFFGGLWWTIPRALASRRPALWFLLGAVGRTGLVMAGFAAVCRAGGAAGLAALAGFALARPAVMRMTRALGPRGSNDVGIGHAPQP